ncbi:MAG: exo-alpha-sialidase [Chloroflexi bacterium]|nr:MAG: exo-alpha-sialidase [Chloroflexota bacterium]
MIMRLATIIFLIVMMSACVTQPAPTANPKPPTATPPAQILTKAPPPIPPTVVDSPDATACEAGDPSIESPLSNHHAYLTYTEDGLNFSPGEEQRIIEHASVPDVVIGPDGALWVYFVNGRPGQHGIFVARQMPNNSWEIVDCVRLNGQFEGNAVDPDITRLPDGRYRLVYFLGNFVNRGTLGPNDPHPIYSAISDDGLNFAIENELISVENVTDPSVVQLPNGSWLMALARRSGVLLASSADGNQFSLMDVSLPPEGIPELALLPDGRLVLFLRQIHISSDGGLTWEVQSEKRVPGNGADPSMTEFPGGGYAFVWKQIEP